MTDDEFIEDMRTMLSPEPLAPAVTERVPWADRFHHPRRFFCPWVTHVALRLPTYGNKRHIGRLLLEWDKREWVIFQQSGGLEDPAREGPQTPVVPWLVHTDCDKRHRCPVCRHSGGFQEQMAQTGGYIRSWHVYTCQECGQRAANRFYLREHPCDRCRPFSHIRWRLRHSRMQFGNWLYEQRRKLRR